MDRAPRGLVMKKFIALIFLLAAALLLSFAPALSADKPLSGGAYGPYVPYGGNFGVEQSVGSHDTVVSGGFYGTRVPFDGAYGVANGDWGSRRAFSGSYGAYGPYLPKGVAETSRSNCMVVATLCPLDIFK